MVRKTLKKTQRQRSRKASNMHSKGKEEMLKARRRRMDVSKELSIFARMIAVSEPFFGNIPDIFV